MQRTVPVAGLVLESFIWPYKSLRDSLLRWNRTHRGLFEYEMTRFIMQNNFFGDKKPYQPFDEVYADAVDTALPPESIPTPSARPVLKAV